MKRFQVANHACLMIKYAKDVRYDQNGVSTHDRSVVSLLSSAGSRDTSYCAGK